MVCAIWILQLGSNSLYAITSICCICFPERIHCTNSSYVWHSYAIDKMFDTLCLIIELNKSLYPLYSLLNYSNQSFNISFISGTYIIIFKL